MNARKSIKFGIPESAVAEDNLHTATVKRLARFKFIDWLTGCFNGAGKEQAKCRESARASGKCQNNHRAEHIFTHRNYCHRRTMERPIGINASN